MLSMCDSRHFAEHESQVDASKTDGGEAPYALVRSGPNRVLVGLYTHTERATSCLDSLMVYSYCAS